MTLLLDFNKKSTRIRCKVNFAQHKTCIIWIYFVGLPLFAILSWSFCRRNLLLQWCTEVVVPCSNKVAGHEIQQKKQQIASWSRNWLWLKYGGTVEGSNTQSVIVMLWFDFLSKDIPVCYRQIGSTTVDPSWHLASAYSKTCSGRSRVKFITFQPSPTSKFLKYWMILGLWLLSITFFFVRDVRQKSTWKFLLKQWNSMNVTIY